jgi:hypothetical protein
VAPGRFILNPRIGNYPQIVSTPGPMRDHVPLILVYGRYQARLLIPCAAAASPESGLR